MHKQPISTTKTNTDNILKLLGLKGPQHTPHQPTWSTIAACRFPDLPRLPRRAFHLAADTALIALKSPPPYYKRELVVYCQKAVEEFQQPAQRLVENLKRATRECEVVGQLQSLRRLPNRDMILRFDTTESRDSWKRCKEIWIGALGIDAHLKERHYTVLIHNFKKSVKGKPEMEG